MERLTREFGGLATGGNVALPSCLGAFQDTLPKDFELQATSH